MNLPQLPLLTNEPMTPQNTHTNTRTNRAAGLVTAVVGGLELIWLFALVRTASQGFRVEVSVFPLLGVYAASFGVSLGLRHFIRSRLLTWMISWLLWPVATFLMLLPLRPLQAAPTAFTVVVGGLLWWLGAHLAARRLTYETVLSEFQVGLLVLAGLLFASHALRLGQSIVAAAAIAFVGLGLVGAAATRTGEESGLALLRRSNTWWGMLLLSVAVVFLLGFLAALLFTPDLMHLLARGIRGLWHLLERFMSAIAGLFPSSDTPPEMPSTPQITGQENEPGFSLTLPESWLRPSRIAYGVFIGGVALAMLWRITSQFFAWARRRADRGEVKVERLRGAFKLDLLRAWRRLAACLKTLLALGILQQRRGEGTTPSLFVRHAYAQMTRWGARSGLARTVSQTPLEYEQVLCATFPTYQDEVAFITRSYMKARYGGEVPSGQEIEQLKTSSRKLKRKAGHLRGRSRKSTTKVDGHATTR